MVVLFLKCECNVGKLWCVLVLLIILLWINVVVCSNLMEVVNVVVFLGFCCLLK